MALRLDRYDWLSLALIVATLLSGLALWEQLPAEMAVHFSASGEPDNVTSKPVAVVSLPALMLATMLFIEGAGRIDPPEDPSVLGVVTAATMALMAAVQGLLFAWNLGHEVPFGLFMAGVAVWMVVVVGYTVAREGRAGLA
ncbi:hypothetical protein C475_04980 [Halosimplex carlsbadense 2-9-1]|uniref:DUF1648 domain-containing protein n=1 Tax=Halosimplex carlsbadense 2-9-1 TaxID=797114 RepID=M0CY24_9EURY|nr:DUF1648 domain-containing protein [Halosimplex carlsbadense]ELZ28131.1 hypothetical protein C475_04980 [Halosimplex carlsbadense 2-9-1]